MFNLKEFIVKNIVNGIKNGTWSKEYANIMAVNYLAKGLLSEEDVASIDAQISVWEQAAKEEVTEDIPMEEVTEPTGEPSEDTGEAESVENETVPEEIETENVENETENIETETDSEETETAE